MGYQKIIEHSLIIFLLVLVIWYTLQEGEVFGKIGNWLYRNTPKKIHPALFECNVCCTPYYGGLLYIFIYGFNIDLIITVLCATGMQVVLNKLSPDKEAPNLTDKVEEIESRLDAHGIYK